MYASKLRAKSNTTAIREQVAGVARGIDTAISIAHADGQSSIVVDLPTNVNIGGMTPSESKVVLYSELVKLYSAPEPEGRGFDVKISVDPAEIIIKWRSGITDDDFEERNGILKKHLVMRRRRDAY